MPLSKAIRDKFVSAAKRLQAVMAEIEQADPDANLYVECDTFHLMSGPSHDMRSDGISFVARQERILESVTIPRCDCGAW